MSRCEDGGWNACADGSGSGGSLASYDANYVRPTSVTYPGPFTRRVVWYNHASTGVGAPMSRLDNIASADEPSDSQKFAAYSYLGASTLIKVEYPDVTSGGNALALTYGTSADSYAGFDPSSVGSWTRSGKSRAPRPTRLRIAPPPTPPAEEDEEHARNTFLPPLSLKPKETSCRRRYFIF